MSKNDRVWARRPSRGQQPVIANEIISESHTFKHEVTHRALLVNDALHICETYNPKNHCHLHLEF